MAENIIKNKRFREGSKVSIYFAPVFEGYTTDIIDSSVGSNYSIVCTMNKDMSIEQLGVGDIFALSFGVGIITLIDSFDVTVSFPNSMFPDANVMRYVGSQTQHCYGFLSSERFIADMQVNRYEEVIKEGTYGHMKATYSLNTQADLLLTPIRKVDDGSLSNCLRSRGFV